MYYYYRVAEELVFVVFVLPSRCANSLKRAPFLTPAPPKKCLIKKLTHNPLPFALAHYHPSVSLLGILR